MQRAQFEKIARNEYAKSEIRSPVACSLYYLALRKKTILQGLWRVANGNREQAATMRLLANNFEEPKWRTAALKNAYALMSKRRFGELEHGPMDLQSMCESMGMRERECVCVC